MIEFPSINWNPLVFVPVFHLGDPKITIQLTKISGHVTMDPNELPFLPTASQATSQIYAPICIVSAVPAYPTGQTLGASCPDLSLRQVALSGTNPALVALVRLSRSAPWIKAEGENA